MAGTAAAAVAGPADRTGAVGSLPSEPLRRPATAATVTRATAAAPASTPAARRRCGHDGEVAAGPDATAGPAGSESSWQLPRRLPGRQRGHGRGSGRHRGHRRSGRCGRHRRRRGRRGRAGRGSITRVASGAGSRTTVRSRVTAAGVAGRPQDRQGVPTGTRRGNRDTRCSRPGAARSAGGTGTQGAGPVVEVLEGRRHVTDGTQCSPRGARHGKGSERAWRGSAVRPCVLPRFQEDGPRCRVSGMLRSRSARATLPNTANVEFDAGPPDRRRGGGVPAPGTGATRGGFGCLPGNRLSAPHH